MAAKKKQQEIVRGAALVEQVIAWIESGKDSGVEIMTPRPISAERLDTLTFSNGKVLPPSLKRLLAYDASWVMRTLRWFDDLDEPELPAASVSQVVRQNISDVFHRAFRTLPHPLPAADVLALDVGSDTMRLLFLTTPDDAGEYPVLGVDVDDMPVVTFESPGFDTWLAVQAGLIDLDRPPWSAYEGDVPDRESIIALAGSAKADSPGTYPYAEVAKTGRSSCIACREPIPKDTVRIAVERTVDTPQGTMPRPGYYHPKCAKGAETVSVEAVLGKTTALSEPQREEIKTALA